MLGREIEKGAEVAVREMVVPVLGERRGSLRRGVTEERRSSRRFVVYEQRERERDA